VEGSRRSKIAWQLRRDPSTARAEVGSLRSG
jgi:hypothetical protein